MSIDTLFDYKWDYKGSSGNCIPVLYQETILEVVQKYTITFLPRAFHTPKLVN